MKQRKHNKVLELTLGKIVAFSISLLVSAVQHRRYESKFTLVPEPNRAVIIKLASSPFRSELSNFRS